MAGGACSPSSSGTAWPDRKAPNRCERHSRGRPAAAGQRGEPNVVGRSRRARALARKRAQEDLDYANAVKEGAVDFVQKPYHEQQLLDTIDEALRRDAAQRAPAGDAGGLSGRVATLTAREREVMALALRGLPSKAIAKELSISHRTVEQHRSRLLEKLGVGSITELMRLTLERSAE